MSINCSEWKDIEGLMEGLKNGCQKETDVLVEIFKKQIEYDTKRYSFERSQFSREELHIIGMSFVFEGIHRYNSNSFSTSFGTYIKNYIHDGFRQLHGAENEGVFPKYKGICCKCGHKGAIWKTMESMLKCPKCNYKEDDHENNNRSGHNDRGIKITQEITFLSLEQDESNAVSMSVSNLTEEEKIIDKIHAENILGYLRENTAKDELKVIDAILENITETGKEPGVRDIAEKTGVSKSKVNYLKKNISVKVTKFGQMGF